MFRFFKKIIVSIIKLIIQFVEKVEYNFISIDEDDISKKILNSISVSGHKVKTDTGYEELSDLHLTQPYTHYELKTESFEILCADNHIVFDEQMNEVFVKDLKVGDKIQTERGLEGVVNLSKTKFKSSMFDASVNHKNHRLYTGGILSHNTISAAIFMLHKILFDTRY